VFIFRVLFFLVVYCASQNNKIISLVNQKMSLERSLYDIVIFKMSLHCFYIDNLQDALKNVSTIRVTLVFKTRFKVSQKYDSIDYIAAN
jgi:hypothetical protein